MILWFHGFQLYRTCRYSDIRKIIQIRSANYVCCRAQLHHVCQHALSIFQVQKRFYAYNQCSSCGSSQLWLSHVEVQEDTIVPGWLFWRSEQRSWITNSSQHHISSHQCCKWPLKSLQVWWALVCKLFEGLSSCLRQSTEPAFLFLLFFPLLMLGVSICKYKKSYAVILLWQGLLVSQHYPYKPRQVRGTTWL